MINFKVFLAGILGSIVMVGVAVVFVSIFILLAFGVKSLEWIDLILLLKSTGLPFAIIGFVGGISFYLELNETLNKETLLKEITEIHQQEKENLEVAIQRMDEGYIKFKEGVVRGYANVITIIKKS